MLILCHVPKRINFASNYLEKREKSVCFDEKHANFWVKHTNSLIFQYPSSRVVGIPIFALARGGGISIKMLPKICETLQRFPDRSLRDAAV